MNAINWNVLGVVVLIQIVLLVISAVFNNSMVARQNELEEERLARQNKIDDSRAQVLAQAIVIGVRQIFDEFVLKNEDDDDSLELIVEVDENRGTTPEIVPDGPDTDEESYE